MHRLHHHAACVRHCATAASAATDDGEDDGGHLLVIGATGIIGRALIERFASSSSWRVSAMSRRQPDYDLGIAEWSHLDLDDRDGTVEALQLVNEVTPVTHCVFGAVFEQPGGLTDSWASKDMIERNDQMFRAFLDAAVVHCKDMRHLTVMQGGKAYGVPGGNVLAPQLPPFKERRPRVHDGELATNTPRSNSC